jgi:hypothetical protein
MNKKNKTFVTLTESQKKSVIESLKRHLPYAEFDIVDGVPYVRGKGGSDADFMEIGVTTLFDLVSSVKFNI